jgi:hypothetical protein
MVREGLVKAKIRFKISPKLDTASERRGPDASHFSLILLVFNLAPR